jgi:biotin carboxyl carrier protein
MLRVEVGESFFFFFFFFFFFSSSSFFRLFRSPNIKQNYIWLTLECTVNGTLALAPERKNSGSLGIVEIGRQFFVPPAQQHTDIVFTSKLYMTDSSPEVVETCAASLRSTVMLDVAKMASVVKNIAFKPVNGMTLRLHLDSHALFQREDGLEDLSRAERYERLQGTLLKKCVRLAPASPSPNASPPPSPPASPPVSPRPKSGLARGPSQVGQIKKPLPVAPSEDSDEPESPGGANGPPAAAAGAATASGSTVHKIACPVDGRVVQMFVSVGSGLLYGSPVCEIEEAESDVVESSMLARPASSHYSLTGSAERANLYEPNESSLYGSTPPRSHLYKSQDALGASRDSYGASKDSYGASQYGVETNNYAAGSNNYGSSNYAPESPRRANAPSNSQGPKRTRIVTWDDKEPAVVTRFHTEKDGILRRGNAIATVDTSR